MTFRARLFVLLSLAILTGAGLFAWGTSRFARQEFSRLDNERSSTLTAQFQRQLQQQGQEVSYAVQQLADAEGTLRMALDLGRAQADPSVYANDARGLATAHQLDFLDIVASDGTLISSAQWPARSGYKNNWVVAEQDWNQHGAFLDRVDLPDGMQLGLIAVRVVTVGEKSLYLIGGRRLDRDFLHSIVLPPGTRALLYRNLDSGFIPDNVTTADGAVDQPERFANLIESAQKSQGSASANIQWTPERASAERFVAIPLTGRQNETLGLVLLGISQRERVTLINSILLAAVLAGALGIFGAFLVSSWASAHSIKPLALLTSGLNEVIVGNWSAHVDLRSRDEAGQAAAAFNRMTTRISQERTRLVQTERVAAWRDVTQRLTHDVKQSLFPLEITVSSLIRSRQESSPQLAEALNESLTALRSELDQLKATVARFSDFAKMPQPRCRPVDVNEILRAVLVSFEPQFRAVGRPPVTPELFLDTNLSKIQADPDLLRKALENLLLHSLDTMPSGGMLTVRTGESKGVVHIQVSGSGPGFGSEQSLHPFSGFRARQAPGSGLGLPTTQAVVADHGGRFFAETVPGVGTTFWLEFAATTEVVAPPAPRIAALTREIRRPLPEIPEANIDTPAPVPSAPAEPSPLPAADTPAPSEPLPAVEPPLKVESSLKED